jgi:glutamyl-tRNA reductase
LFVKSPYIITVRIVSYLSRTRAFFGTPRSRINHHSAPLEVREKLAFPPERQGDALAELAGEPGVAEAVLVSTCNRTEIYCSAESETKVREWLNRHASRNGLQLDGYLYSHATRRR